MTKPGPRAALWDVRGAQHTNLCRRARTVADSVDHESDSSPSGTWLSVRGAMSTQCKPRHIYSMWRVKTQKWPLQYIYRHAIPYRSSMAARKVVQVPARSIDRPVGAGQSATGRSESRESSLATCVNICFNSCLFCSWAGVWFVYMHACQVVGTDGSVSCSSSQTAVIESASFGLQMIELKAVRSNL